MNHRNSLSLSSQAILFPNLAENGNLKFKGWHTNTNFNDIFQSTETSEATIVHGLYGIIVTVTFISNKESKASFT